MASRVGFFRCIALRQVQREATRMPVFGSRSKTFLMLVHPDLVRVCHAAIERIDFSVICGQRGRSAQEAAHAAGNSNARFGQSPHNFNPALAIDMLPSPFNGDWNDVSLVPRLREIANVFKSCGHGMGIEVDWGGDWKSLKDYPHIELRDWKLRAAHLPLAG